MATALNVVPMQKPNLAPRLMIYSLAISAWSARGKDDDMTEAAKAAKGIKSGTKAGNFNKVKLDCPELDAILTYQGKVRTEFYNRTVPWGEISNVRGGKVENHMPFMLWFGDMQAGLEPLKQAFRDKYLERVEEQRYELQGAFKEEDYPPVDEVIGRYRLNIVARPLTNVDDIRVLTEIPADERKRLEDMVLKEQEESIRQSMEYSLGKLMPKVANLAKQLKDYSDGKVKRLFDSLVENVIEMADRAKELNLCNSAEVDELAAKAKEMVADVTSDKLKVDSAERDRVRKEAEALAAKMATYFGNT